MKSNVKYKLNIFREDDWNRPYIGKTHTKDTAIGILSGTTVTESDDTSTSYAPKIIITATPNRRIERVYKVPDVVMTDKITLAEYDDIEHKEKAIVISDTDDDPLMIREYVDKSYSYAFGLGQVQIHGYKYVPHLDKIIAKVEAATYQLGVREQLEDVIDEFLGKNKNEKKEVVNKGG